METVFKTPLGGIRMLTCSDTYRACAPERPSRGEERLLEHGAVADARLQHERAGPELAPGRLRILRHF